MDVGELLKQGDLVQAKARATEAVKAAPTDAKQRIMLFQLLCVTGEWARAITQLNVAAELDGTALGMAQAYRAALNCQALRDAVHAGQRTPLVLGEPPEWLGPLLESIRLAGKGEHAAAQPLRESAFEAAPATPGTIDDTPFEWIADADPRFGPSVEAFVNGKYYIIPFVNIHEIYFEEPADLRDVVWTPVNFVWTNGGDAPGFIPTRYPGAEASDDDAIRLSRRTEWHEAAPDVWIGKGQRMFATDAGEYPLMDIRKITIENADNPSASEPQT